MLLTVSSALCVCQLKCSTVVTSVQFVLVFLFVFAFVVVFVSANDDVLEKAEGNFFKFSSIMPIYI